MSGMSCNAAGRTQRESPIVTEVAVTGTARFQRFALCSQIRTRDLFTHFHPGARPRSGCVYGEKSTSVPTSTTGDSRLSVRRFLFSFTRFLVHVYPKSTLLARHANFFGTLAGAHLRRRSFHFPITTSSMQ